jgi:hypothetical protein
MAQHRHGRRNEFNCPFDYVQIDGLVSQANLFKNWKIVVTYFF